MKKCYAILIAALALAAGCINPPPPSSNIPSDLEIYYTYGSCHAEGGRTNIRILSDGSGLYESGKGPLTDDGKFSENDSRKTFKLGETEVLTLLNDIEKSNFYSLKEGYSDFSIQDGSCSYISVTSNNKTKSVSVSNTDAPEEFSKAASLIGKAAGGPE